MTACPGTPDHDVNSVPLVTMETQLKKEKYVVLASVQVTSICLTPRPAACPLGNVLSVSTTPWDPGVPIVRTGTMETQLPSKIAKPVHVTSVVLCHVTVTWDPANVSQMWKVSTVTDASLTHMDLIAVLDVRIVTVVSLQ